MTNHNRDAQRRRSFYASAFDEKDQDLLWQALDLQGIDEEIGTLRLLLQKQLVDDPHAYDRLLKNTDLIVRAVATQYRMGPNSARDFAERITQTLRDLGEQIAPGLIEGGGHV